MDNRASILFALERVQAELDSLRSLVEGEEPEPAPEPQQEWLETYQIVCRFGITDDHARKLARRLEHTGGSKKPEGRWLLDPVAVQEELGRHV